MNAKIRKILRETEHKPEPAAFIQPIDAEFVSQEIRKELLNITTEMLVTTFFRDIEKLDPVDQKVLRYSYGFPKDYNGNNYYPQLKRKELAEMLGLDKRDLIWIRHDATKRLLRMLFNGDTED